MALSNELAKTRVVTRDGVATVTVLDRVSPDRMSLSLIRGAAAARYGQVDDETELLSRSVKDLLVFPFSEL